MSQEVAQYSHVRRDNISLKISHKNKPYSDKQS